MTQNFKYFFTFISKSPAVRLAGFTTIGFLFFGWISYCFWKQHLLDDVDIKNESKQKDIRIIEAEKARQQIAVDYLNYVKQTTRRNDSIALDNQRFIEELKRRK